MRSTTPTFGQSSLRDATRATAASASAIGVGGIRAGGSGKAGDDMATSPSFNEMPEPTPADAVRTTRRPPHDQRLALDVLQRHRPPVARIVAVVAVVSEDEHRVLGDDVGLAPVGEVAAV